MSLHCARAEGRGPRAEEECRPICPACGAQLAEALTVAEGAGWRMMLGDCVDVLRSLPARSVAAIITDPPYGSGGDTRAARMVRSGKKYMNSDSSYQHSLPDMAGDAVTPEAWTVMMRRAFEQMVRVLEPDGVLAVMCDWRQKPLVWSLLSGAGVRVRGEVVWDKGLGTRPVRGGFRNQCEYVLWGGIGSLQRADWYGAGVFQHTTMTGGKVHQTQKPLALMRDLVEVCRPGGLICDPFSGSGTTGVAVLESGRRFVGIERVPAYFDVSVTRLRAAEAQP